jgi:hypothetical protein
VIKQYNSGVPPVAILEPSAVMQVVERFRAIASHHDLIREPALRESQQRQLYVVRVVINKQYMFHA